MISLTEDVTGFTQFPQIHLGHGAKTWLRSKAHHLLLGQMDEIIKMTYVTSLQERIAKHLHKGWCDGHGKAKSDPVLPESMEDIQQRYIRLRNGFKQPALLQGVGIVRMTHVGQVCV